MAPGAGAATLTWDGGGATSNWAEANNWNPNQLPVAGDTLQFGGALKLAPQNTVAEFSVQGLAFIAGAGSFTLGGQSINLGAGGIVNNSANAQTITLGISLQGSQTWAANTGALTFTGFIQRDAASTLTITGAANTTFTGSASAPGTTRMDLVKEGSGTLILNNPSTSSFGDPFGFHHWTINQGTLRLGASHQIDVGGLAGDVVVNGGTFDIGAFSDTVGSLRLTSGTLTGTTGVLGTLGAFGFGSFTLESGTVSAILGNGVNDSGSTQVASVSKVGTGTVTMTRANSYTGATTVSGGTLSLTADNALSASSAVVVASGATLGFAGTMQRAGSLADGTGGGGSINLGSATLTIGTNTAAASFSGVISGSGGLVKAGGGTQALTGVNTYTGGTTINAGTLSIDKNRALGALGTAVTLNGGTLQTTQTFATDRPITLGSSNGTINVLSATELTASNLMGPGELNKTGFGTLVVTGATYGGGTRISQGSLRVTSDAHLGAAGAPLTLNGGFLEAAASFDLGAARAVTTSFGGFSVVSGATLTVSNPIAGASGTSRLDKQGPGTLVLSGANTYTGSTNVEDGTLLLGASERLANASSLSVGESSFFSGTSGTFNLGSHSETLNTVTLFRGSIVGTGVLTADQYNLREGTISAQMAGGSVRMQPMTSVPTNVAVLTANNVYTGSTTIEGGTLRVGSANNVIPDGSALVIASPFGNPASAVFDVGAFSETVGAVTLQLGSITGSGVLTGASYDVQGGMISARLGGGAALTKNAPGTVILSGSNSYSGGTIVNDGVLSISSDANLGAASGSLALNGGTFEATASLASGRAVSLAGTPAISPAAGTSLTLAGNVGGAGNLLKRGEGTLVLAGVNSYTGATTVEAGTLRLGAAQRIPDGSALTLGAAGTLDLNGFNEVLASLSGAGAVELGSGTLFVGFNNADSLYTGRISGSGGVTKFGSGNLALGGSNTYSGATNISAGTLSLAAHAVIPDASAVTIAPGAVLALNGFTDLIGSLSGAGQVTLGAGRLGVGLNGASTTYSGNISGEGDLVKLGAGVLTLGGTNTHLGGTTVTGGALRVSQDANLGPEFAQLTIDGAALQTTASFATFRPVTVGPAHATLETAAGTTLTLANTVEGPGGLIKTGAGTLVLSGIYDYGGMTRVSAGVLEARAGYLAPGAAIEVESAGELRTRGVVNRQVLGTGTVSASGTLILGQLTSPGGVSFGGTLNVGSQLVQLAGEGQAMLGGTVNLAEGGRLTTLNQEAGTVLAAGATLHASGNAFIDGNFLNRGLVSGPGAPDASLFFSDNVRGGGSYAGNVTFLQDFSPGESAARIEMDNATFSASSRLYMELGGLGALSDSLDVEGLLKLEGGLLKVTLIDGFVPEANDAFDLFDFDEIRGTFGTVTLPTLGNGLSWSTASLYTDGTISVAAIPEPETYALMLAGLGLLGFVARRRRRPG